MIVGKGHYGITMVMASRSYAISGAYAGQCKYLRTSKHTTQLIPVNNRVKNLRSCCRPRFAQSRALSHSAWFQLNIFQTCDFISKRGTCLDHNKLSSFTTSPRQPFCIRFYSSYNNTASSNTKTEENLDTITTTHFGFSTVAEDEKVEKVYEVFKKVAETYDLMNDVMSVGIHRLWKDEFVHQLSPHDGMKLMDAAGGTGDIALRYMKYSSDDKTSASNNRQVTVCDINEHMLQVGERRAVQQGVTDGIEWLQGNAESLPVESNSYDAFTIAFGIRNCTNVKKVLSEAYRVLKPGGRFMCLEFSEMTNPVLQSVYDQYSFQIIPVLGHVIAKDWNSYQYLVESIRRFPNQTTFAKWIKEAGFSAVTFNNLTFGIASIHSGFKL